jgi:hypothetical protein
MFASRFAVALCVLPTILMGAAVAQNQPPTAPPDKNSADYHVGHADGCMHATSGLPRNENRYKTNVEYRLGWETGFKECYDHQTINTNGDPNGPMKNVF